MVVKRIFPHEVLVTLVTVIVLDARVGDEVTLQRGVVGKAFLTYLTDEWVGDFVDWHVFFEIYSGSKRSLTEVTLKPFVAMESLHVLDKIVSERKCLVTVIALPFVLKVKSKMFF